MSQYKVRAIYCDDPKPFAEIVGTYASKLQAEMAKESFEDQEDAPNFLGCDILDLSEVLE